MASIAKVDIHLPPKKNYQENNRDNFKIHLEKMEGEKENTSKRIKNKRQSLKVLQPCATGGNRLVGGKGFVQLKREKGKNHAAASSRLENSIPACANNDESKNSSIKCDDPVNLEVLNMLTFETVPENYWKELAERRRLALKTALLENEQLHKSLKQLKKENELLTKLAEQASNLSTILAEAGLI